MPKIPLALQELKMKLFRYLFFLEIFIISSIFIFFGDKESNQALYDFVNQYVSEHKWVVSTKYYEASKITSVLVTFFIILNTIYLMVWVYFNYDKPTTAYDLSYFYKIEDIKALCSLPIGGIVLFLVYHGKPISLAHSTNKLVPPDGLLGIIYLDSAMLLTMTFCAFSTFILISNITYRIYTLFK